MSDILLEAAQNRADELEAAYIELWAATENGMTTGEFFALRERFRRTIQTENIALAPPHEEQEPMIMVYSPVSFGTAQAIVLNKTGRALLRKMLDSKQEIVTEEVVYCTDGDGGKFGIVEIKDEEYGKYMMPYLLDGVRFSGIDPRDLTDAATLKKGDE